MQAGLKVKPRFNLQSLDILPMNATTSTHVAAEVMRQTTPSKRWKPSHEFLTNTGSTPGRIWHSPRSGSTIRNHRLLRLPRRPRALCGGILESVGPQASKRHQQAAARLRKALQASREIAFASLACKPSFFRYPQRLVGKKRRMRNCGFPLSSVGTSDCGTQ
jgi:hypothetical protein